MCLTDLTHQSLAPMILKAYNFELGILSLAFSTFLDQVLSYLTNYRSQLFPPVSNITAILKNYAQNQPCFAAIPSCHICVCDWLCPSHTPSTCPT
jgi:hypothetical protein